MADNIFDFGNGSSQAKRGDGPPDLELPPGLIKRIIIVLVLLVVGIFLSTSAYTVAPDEEAVVLRLGKLYGAPMQSGIHFKLPFPVDRVYKVATKKIHKEEFGFRTESAGIRTTFATPRQLTQAESLILSGDLNMAIVEWVVQYRISDPIAYLFNIAEPVQTLRDVTEAMMRRVVGDKGVDQVLTVGRVEVENKVAVAIQATMKRYNTGITVEQVKLKNVKPPEPVQASFNDVNMATQDKQRLENQALATYNEAIPKAEGEANQRLASAEGYAIERVNQARGDADRFKRVYEEYRKAPDVTRRRLYLEAMARVLPKVKDIIVIDEAGKGILPLLNLGQGAGK